jgi:hypothetical protein
MKRSVLRGTGSLLVLAVGVGVSWLGVQEAVAQQVQTLSYKVSAENSKYTQQHAIDVGDVPGHQVRVYEIHRLFPKDAPAYDGVRVVESWTRAISDYVDFSGPGTVYTVTVLENGDKIFSRGDLVAYTEKSSGEARTTMATTVAQITGGTGKFRGIRGTVKSLAVADIKAGVNEVQSEVEYWIETPAVGSTMAPATK